MILDKPPVIIYNVVMDNTWKVHWTNEAGKPTIKRFGDLQEAVAFGKNLKRNGADAQLISGHKPFKPGIKAGPKPDRKHYWCPYCAKWRQFVLTGVRNKHLHVPAEWRCPICLISMRDYYVRRYNGKLHITAEELVRKLKG